MKTFKISFIMAVLLAISAMTEITAQVTIGSEKAPESYSILELVSNNSGLRLPQLDGNQRTALENTFKNIPALNEQAMGLQIFNLTTLCVETWNGTVWISPCTETLTTYSVTYNGNGGTPASQIGTPQADGTPFVNPPTIPTRTGYTLAGWNTAANGSGTTYTVGATNITGTVTVYAQWAPIAYNVTYNGNNGTPATQIKSHNYGTTFTNPTTTVTRTGYTLAGWNTAANGSGTTYTVGTTTITGAVTVYAQWTPIAYNVTYNGNNGTPATQTKSHNYGTTFTNPTTTVTRTGYTLAGWNTAANGSGTTYTVGATNITGAVTVYAQWTPIAYTVTYNGNNGTPATQTKAHNYGTTFTNPTTTVTRTGYTLAGWNTAANGSGTTYTVGTTNITGAVTVYAQWTCAIPSAPNGVNTTECRTFEYMNVYATPPAGCVVEWYAAATGGSPLAALDDYTYQILSPVIPLPAPATGGSSSVTYYAQSKNTTTGCVSATRTPVTASVSTLINSYYDVSDITIDVCNPDYHLAYTFSPTIQINTIKFYSGAQLINTDNYGGMCVSSTSLYPSISEWTSKMGTAPGVYPYSVEFTDAYGNVRVVSGNVTVTSCIPDPPAGINTTECRTFEYMNVYATPPAGCVVEWYAAATGGSPLAALDDYTYQILSPVIPLPAPATGGSSSVTYYAQSKNTTTGYVSATRTPVTASVSTLLNNYYWVMDIMSGLDDVTIKLSDEHYVINYGVTPSTQMNTFKFYSGAQLIYQNSIGGTCTGGHTSSCLTSGWTSKMGTTPGVYPYTFEFTDAYGNVRVVSGNVIVTN